MKYKDWLADFEKGKAEIEVPQSRESASFAGQIRRFKDEEGNYWEYARTYTGRLILRSGSYQKGVIVWKDWTTLHHIEL